MKRTDSFAQQKTHNHQLPGSNTNPLEIASTANYDRHKTNTSLGLTTISVIYDRRQQRGGPKRSALQRFPACLNLSHHYSHLQVRLLTPMAKRLTFSRNSLRSNVHPWTKQKSSPQVHRTLSPRTTRPSPFRRFRSQPCSAHLCQLPTHKATVVQNGLTNRLLKAIATAITESLTHLFNLSVKTHAFPSDWKHALVTPIFKNRGDKQLPSNYRPVSILPALGKILDNIQSTFLLKYLEEYHLLSSHQFGFRASLSTTKQLVYITHQWISNLNSKKDTLAVFMDFHKAFDRVWHNGLLYKLGQLGISHSALSWLQDYLTNRTLSVKVGQSRSPDYQLSAGVPQGSHLGPVLFLAYINDLPTVVTSPADLYADDALLHDTVEQTNALQRNINAAVTWATTWRGGFSAAKTILLHIGNRNRSGDHTLNISGQPLQADTHHKHLGLIFSDSLSWSYHLDKLIISSRRKAGLLRYMTPNMSASVSSKLYLTWVRPTMEYACPVWHASISKEDSLTLERIQASVARRILQADWSTPKELLFQSLDWPALWWRRSVLSVCLLFDLMTNATSPLKDCLFPCVSTKSSYNFRKPKQLLLPKTHSTRHQQSFFYHASLLWNTLPNSTQQASSKETFKKEVERHWSHLKFDPQGRIPY